MKFVCDSEKCTGCGLCKNICPRNAIQMVPKETTGHFYPVIDSEKCVDCGLCRKMCPTMDEEEFRELHGERMPNNRKEAVPGVWQPHYMRQRYPMAFILWEPGQQMTLLHK